MGVVAGRSEQVSVAVEIKGVYYLLVAGDGASFKYQIRHTNEP